MCLSLDVRTGFTLCLVGAAFYCLAAPRAVGPNLVSNPGFEEASSPAGVPAGWRADPAVYACDTNHVRGGSASLRFAGTDPGTYRLCSARVTARPGLKYAFSAWIKTCGISGDDSGATLCLEWVDRKGKWLGGVYPPGIKGTRDWTRVEQFVVYIPTNAARTTLSCYVRKGMTGEAWFDDVRLHRVLDASLESVLVSPPYRGRVARNGPTNAVVRAFVNPESFRGLELGDLRLIATLRDASGRATYTRSTTTRPNRCEYDLQFPAVTLSPGAYEAEVRLVSGSGDVRDLATHRIVRTPDDFCARVRVDERLRLLVEERPFFPLGMYWGTINEKDLETFTDSSFNCLMPYGSPTREQMDLAQGHGLKVIYSVKDMYAGSRWCPGAIKDTVDEERLVRAKLREFRDHPALLAWYLNDELPQTYMPRLEAHQRWVEEDDPHHPAWVVLYQYRQVRDYIGSFDVIGTDPYPIPRKPASMAAEWTAETRRQVSGARPLWQVPQSHNWGNYPGYEKDVRSPTYDEMRSMAWQCICEGANGIVFYSFFDLKKNADVPFEEQWGRLKRIAAEIDRWAPVLLSVDPVPAAFPIAGRTPDWLHWRMHSAGDRTYLFVVNDGDGEGAVTFDVPKGNRSVTVNGGERVLPVTEGQFVDTLSRLDFRVYTLVPE
jgi:hypothetical protein